LGKKINDKERPEAFNRFRDEAFTKAKANYDSSNLIHYETYRKALRRFGLVDDFQMFKYPDTAFSYDLRTEDGIASLMAKVAEDYLEIKNGFESDPQSIRDELWPLFRVDYNPKFESFANDQLAEIDMDISQIDKIIKTEGGDEGASKAAAKGTSLEGTVGNPISLAESIRYTVDLRYIQSFGYTMEGIKNTIGKQDLFNLVQRNLGKDAPFKLSEEEQKAMDLAELKERAAQSKTSPINEPTLPTEPAPTSPLNPGVEVTPETETGVTNTSAVTGAPTQLPPETQAPPTEGGVTVNVEASPPVQTVPQETVPGTSVINEIEIKAAQEKLASGPMAETLKASGINLTSEKVSEILSNKETVQSQIQTVPTATSPIGSTTESTNNVTEKTQTTISSEKSGASVINELEIKKAQEKLASGPLADLLKASGINLTSEKISDVLSVKEKEKTDTTTTSQTNQINQVDEKVKTSQIDSTLEATTTKQNISGETTNKENLGVTKDQMMMPKAPPPSEPAPGPGVSNVTQTPQGQTTPPETITGTDTTLSQGGETQAGPTQGAGPSQPAPSIGNLSELEARLARIEFLLSGPLDVKIIE
jgi:hypothetical protein